MHNTTLVVVLGSSERERWQEIERGLIDSIAQRVGEHIYPLDPHEPEAGLLDSRWRIRENVDVLREL